MKTVNAQGLRLMLIFNSTPVINNKFLYLLNYTVLLGILISCPGFISD